MYDRITNWSFRLGYIHKSFFCHCRFSPSCTCCSPNAPQPPTWHCSSTLRSAFATWRPPPSCATMSLRCAMHCIACIRIAFGGPATSIWCRALAGMPSVCRSSFRRSTPIRFNVGYSTSLCICHCCRPRRWQKDSSYCGRSLSRVAILSGSSFVFCTKSGLLCRYVQCL